MSTGRLGAGDTAIQPTIVDAKGDLITATAADTPARLAVGTNGHILVANSSTSTGLEWQAPAGGGMTLISSQTLSASTGLSFSSISSSYKHLLLIWNGLFQSDNTSPFDVRLNNNSNQVYPFMTYFGSNTTLTQRNGDTATSLGTSTTPLMGVGVDQTGLHNRAIGYLWVYDYASTTKFKQCFASYRYYDSAASAHKQIWASHISFNSTSAVSSVDIVRLSGTGTMSNQTDTQIALYGVS